MKRTSFDKKSKLFYFRHLLQLNEQNLLTRETKSTKKIETTLVLHVFSTIFVFLIFEKSGLEAYPFLRKLGQKFVCFVFSLLVQQSGHFVFTNDNKI